MADVQVSAKASIEGPLVINNMALPSASVKDESVEASADISASKLEHQHRITYGLDTVAGTVATAGATGGQTFPIHVCRGAGTIQSFGGGCAVDPTAGTITIDLLKATAAGAAATVLTSAVTITNGDSHYAIEDATVGTTTVADGDILLVKFSQTTHPGCTACLGAYGHLNLYESI